VGAEQEVGEEMEDEEGGEFAGGDHRRRRHPGLGSIFDFYSTSVKIES
jgi:hypothetical protein